MDNTRKLAIFLALFAGISLFTFADTFYGFSIGSFRLSEQFDSNYGRELDGLNVSIDINHFFGRSPFGWFIHGSAGAGIYGYEWTESDMLSYDVYSITDMRFSFGPAFKIISGPKIAIPISLGPSIANYREEDYYYDATVYETINIGVFTDAAILLIPFKWFYIRTGISASWDFIQFGRKGIQIDIRNNFFDDYKYSSLNIGFYSGIGIRFE